MNALGISIIIPFFNRSDISEETFASVIDQSDPRWECIIVDDGSRPEEIKFIEDYCDRQPNFTLINRSSSTKGASTCRNEGSQQAKFDYVLFLDSDDILDLDIVKNSLHILENDPSLDAAIFQCKLFEKQPEDREEFQNIFDDRNDLYRFLTHDNPWMTSSGIWKNSFIEKMGGWTESLPTHQDWDFHIRALAYEPNYIKNSQTGYYWRVASSESRISNKCADSTTLLLLANNFIEFTKLLKGRNIESDNLHSATEALAFWYCMVLSRTSKSSHATKIWKQFNKLYPVSGSTYFKTWLKLIQYRIATKALNFFQRLAYDSFDEQVWGEHNPHITKTRHTT